MTFSIAVSYTHLAEALEEAGGKAVKEAYLYLFGLKKFIPVKIADQTKIFLK